MLRSTTELSDCTIGATDGTIGSVKDVYFDDDKWVVRSYRRYRRVVVQSQGLDLTHGDR